MTPTGLTEITDAIQLALTPVFLLTGIAGMLNVMSGRLSRIIDRGRVVTEDWTEEQTRMYQPELRDLERRRHFVSYAITATTIAALFLCLLITVLFLEVVLGVVLYWLVGVLFMLATLALSVGLGYFLREVHMATRTVRLVPRKGR